MGFTGNVEAAKLGPRFMRRTEEEMATLARDIKKAGERVGAASLNVAIEKNHLVTMQGEHNRAQTAQRNLLSEKEKELIAATAALEKLQEIVGGSV